MRIVFMGTPDFAVPSLRRLVEDGHEVCGVFTQPDKPKNRGMKLLPPPVKEYALSVGIPVFQPTTLRDGSALEQLRELAPQLIVVAAYGKILPVDILQLPPLGCINVHSSLLPKYRGAAPINWAILNGESETGVTIMYMAEGLDTGDMLASAATPIDLNESAQQLHDRLAQMGADLLPQVLDQLEKGTAVAGPPDDAQSCYAPMPPPAPAPLPKWTAGVSGARPLPPGFVHQPQHQGPPAAGEKRQRQPKAAVLKGRLYTFGGHKPQAQDSHS